MNLEEIRTRASAATEGPWHRVGTSIDADVPLSDDGPTTTRWNTTVVCSVGAWGSGRPIEADAEFIAHARTDVPALLDEIERLTRENARLRTAWPNVALLRELAGALNRMQAKHPHGNYVGYGDAILTALGEDLGYMGKTLRVEIAPDPLGTECLRCRHARNWHENANGWCAIVVDGTPCGCYFVSPSAHAPEGGAS